MKIAISNTSTPFCLVYQSPQAINTLGLNLPVWRLQDFVLFCLPELATVTLSDLQSAGTLWPLNAFKCSAFTNSACFKWVAQSVDFGVFVLCLTSHWLLETCSAGWSVAKSNDPGCAWVYIPYSIPQCTARFGRL